MFTDALRALLARRLERGASGLAPRAAGRFGMGGMERAHRRPTPAPALRRSRHRGGRRGARRRGQDAGRHRPRPRLRRAGRTRGAHRSRLPRPPGARLAWCGSDDSVATVGDDALARGAAPRREVAAVVVAPRRQAAIDHAAALGHRVLVVDGLLQTAPGSARRRPSSSSTRSRPGAPARVLRRAISGPRARPCSRPPISSPRSAPEGTAAHPALPPGAISVSEPHRRRSLAGRGSDRARRARGSPRRPAPGGRAARAHRLGACSCRGSPGRHPPARRPCRPDGGDPRDAPGEPPWTRGSPRARCATKLPATIGGRPVLALRAPRRGRRAGGPPCNAGWGMTAGPC